MAFRSCCGCDPCCCGGSKCGCDDKHKKHDEDSAYLKFSGILSVDAAALTFYLGDAGPVILTPNTVVSYPAARSGKLKNMAVNITPGVLVPVNGLLAVQLFKNGLPAPDFLITWGPGETTGLKSIKTDSLKLKKDDLFDLRVTLTNIPLGPLVVTATIGVR
jgi:hypothetical protein